MRLLRLALVALVVALAALAIDRGPRSADASGGGVAVLQTYRAVSSTAVAVSAGVGDIAELRGVAGHIARIKRITISQPTVAFTLNVVKRSTQDASGTPVSATAVALDSINATAGAFVVGYTSKPTAGSAVGNVYPACAVATTGGPLTINFGESDSQCLTVRAGEAIALTTDTASTIPWMIEYLDAGQ